MTSPLRRAVVYALWLVPSGSLAGQASGTLGLGASIVEYDGFLPSGAVVLSSALRVDRRRLSLGAQAAITAFQSGTAVVQGDGGLAWLAVRRPRWRLEWFGSAGAAKYADQPGWGHVLAGTRLHLIGRGGAGGSWLGLTAGQSFGTTDRTPVELSVAGWSVRQRLSLVGSAAATWVGASRYLDLIGALRWAGPRFELEGRVGLRPLVHSSGEVGDAVTGGYGDLVATVPVTPLVAITVGAGSYPSDPTRRVLGATYATAGVRLRIRGPSGLGGASRLLAVGRAEPEVESDARIEAGASDAEGRRIVRVRARGAGRVELMADFTDWLPVSMTQVRGEVWEASLVVPAGVHRVNVRRDGGAWIAPAGTRVEKTEFGGTVGILVVP